MSNSDSLYIYKSRCDDLKERYDKTICLKQTGNRLVEVEKPDFQTLTGGSVPYFDQFPVKKDGLILFRPDCACTMFVTLHTCGYVALFKPDLAEVLSQLPASVFDRKKVYLSVDLANGIPISYAEVQSDKPYYQYCYHRGHVTVYDGPPTEPVYTRPVPLPWLAKRMQTIAGDVYPSDQVVDTLVNVLSTLGSYYSDRPLPEPSVLYSIGEDTLEISWPTVGLYIRPKYAVMFQPLIPERRRFALPDENVNLASAVWRCL